MRNPARFVAGNLIWSTDGGVWAVWRVTPLTYRYRSLDDKLKIHGRLKTALTGLPANSMLASVCREVDPADTVAAMSQRQTGVPSAAWRQAVAAAERQLAATGVLDRRLYLAVQLPDARTGRAAVSGALDRFAQTLRLTGRPATRAEIGRCRQLADGVAARLAAGLQLTEATPGELRWLYHRTLLRGQLEPPLELDWTPSATCGLLSLPDAIVYEGGRRDDADRPTHRRYLRIDTEHGSSFQTVLTMSDLPRQWTFPDGLGEWFAAMDTQPFAIDWAARIRTITNQEAQLKSRRQARQLQAQIDEYEGEPSGPPPSLGDALEAVDAERTELAATRNPELEVTMLFGLASDSLADLEVQASELQSLFAGYEYQLPRPTGGQLRLLRSMLPGAAAAPICRSYAQWLMPGDLASGMPHASAELGDPAGMLLGYNLDAQLRPVLFDPAYGPSVNRSASTGVFGAVGSGKSYMVKRMAWATLACGGRVIALDRTNVGEYARFATVAPGVSKVVELAADSEANLDPLAVFDTLDDRVAYAVGFLTQLTGIAPTSLASTVLEDAVTAVAQRGGRLAEVITHLGEAAEADRDADELYRKLRTLARTPIARLAFGAGQPLELDADYVVLWTPGLTLPSRSELEHPDRLRRDQVVSQALLYLVAAIARTITFADPDRFAAALFDEAWSLTASDEGRELLLSGVRDGRKHNAAVWVISQHPDDLGDRRLAELLGPRIVFRQSGDGAAKAAELLGLDAERRWIDRLETDDPHDGLATGQCLVRDVRGRVGRIEVAVAETDELAAAINTTPNAGLRQPDEPTAT